MKAAEYAKLYQSDSSQPGMAKICKMFLDEIYTLAKSRNAKTDPAICAVLDELDQKWRAFGRLVPDVRPDGFMVLIEQMLPKMYKPWLELRANHGRPLPPERIVPDQRDIDKLWLAALFGTKFDE